MTEKQQTLLQAVKDYLGEKQIKHKEAVEKNWPSEVRLLVKTPDILIAVIACAPSREAAIYKDMSPRKHRPFFLREGDSVEYTIEKLGNCLKGKTIAQLQREALVGVDPRVSSEPQPRPKRQRIHIPVYEKVQPK